MVDQMLSRPAMGQVASLGSLYDARSDSFISFSLLRKTPPTECIETTGMPSTTIKFSKTDTFQEKFDQLHIPAELQASFLAGLVKVGVSRLYLDDKRQTNQVAQCTLHYSTTTVEQTLQLSSPDVCPCLDRIILGTGLATHVVTGIRWGANCVVTAKSQVTRQQDISEISGELEAQMNELIAPGLTVKGSAGVNKIATCQDSGSSSYITVHGNVVADDGLMPTDLESAKIFMSKIPKYIQNANDGKGKPIAFMLMPLSILRMFGYPEVRTDMILRQLSIDYVESFVRLFEILGIPSRSSTTIKRGFSIMKLLLLQPM
ncbi:hypothetical protein N7520_008833 [Penicillium odoratum]|uniref:uncharacterized protein n=1 Tax=Penicillium odoratum TaxID=1167516 RepID=UPI002549916A|nr:uncharacterized protein N7520_008833 [Penicillium odoratum]KAJ5751916.1 hypothetical protein N7520_008833 [Penicillium odoratum]